MDEQLSTITSVLQERFGVVPSEFRGDASLVVLPETIVNVCQVLRDEFEFEMLVEETAVDYWPEETPRFHLVYGIRSIKNKRFLMLRVHLNGNSPSIMSIETIYANANWFERELWDMFGIRFEGHSDLRRIIMPNDWEGHPLRKNYPLGYEEVQFSFNFKEIDDRKPFAEE